MFHCRPSLKVFIPAMLYRVKWFISNEIDAYKPMFTCSKSYQHVEYSLIVLAWYPSLRYPRGTQSFQTPMWSSHPTPLCAASGWLTNGLVVDFGFDTPTSTRPQGSTLNTIGSSKRKKFVKLLHVTSLRFENLGWQLIFKFPKFQPEETNAGSIQRPSLFVQLEMFTIGTRTQLGRHVDKGDKQWAGRRNR